MAKTNRDGSMSVSISNGGSTSTITTGQVEVGTTATLIVAANPSRRFLEISVVGATDVYIGNIDVTITTGHKIESATGYFRMEGVVSTAAIYGDSSAASVVTYIEF